MNVQIEPSWKEVLREDFEQPYFRQLTDRVRRAYAEGQCFPPAPLIFNAFNLCPCLLYTSPSPRDKRQSRMPSSA